MSRRRRSRGPTPARARRSSTVAGWPDIPGWVGPALIAAAAVFMTVWSWGTWADVVIDFGRELYVPWQLSAGQVLYRDVAYFNGPLSPHVNAAWFSLWGVGLRTLVVANLLIMALIVSLLYAILSRIGRRLTAMVGGLVFVAVFGFSQYVAVANYNYVCPYSHEATHGTLLSLTALLCVGRYAERGRLVDAAGAGLAVGLVFLTKPEFLLAIAPAVALGLLLAVRDRERHAGAWQVAATALLAMLAVVLGAWGLLSLRLPVSEAWRGVCGALPWLFDARLTTLPFYKKSMGILNPAESLAMVLRWAVAYLVVLGPAAALGLATRRWPRYLGAITCCAALATLIALAALYRRVTWTEALRPLPVVLFAACGLLAARWRAARGTPEAPRVALAVTMVAFALLLLAKVFLNARAYHYGFALAMPAAMVAIVVLLDWVPAAIERRGGSGWPLRAAALVGLGVVVVAHLTLTGAAFRSKTIRVGTGGDAMLSDDAGAEVNRVLRDVAEHVGGEHTFAVAPEGVMLNYLLRQPNPTPYVNFMPPEVIMFGEEAMLAAFERHPPDFLVWTTQGTATYGFRGFGQGYAERLREWFEANYEPIGPLPPDDGRFHMFLVRRSGPRPEAR